MTLPSVRHVLTCRELLDRLRLLCNLLDREMSDSEARATLRAAGCELAQILASMWRQM